MPELATERRRSFVSGRALGCLLLALVLGVNGCGAGSPDGVELPEAAGVDLPGENDPSATAPVPRRWPLTGIPVQGELPGHGVFVVKIDNTAGAEPQVGLAAADLVTEELVEGGLSRLAVFYHSKLPRVVGPVRSMRASDIGIVKPARAVLVGSGAARVTYARLAKAHVPRLTQSEPGFFRSGERVVPYNLMLRLPQLVRSAESQPAPAPYLPFGPERAFPAGRPATSAAAVFSAAHTTSWEYVEGEGWTRVDSLAAEGQDFVADTVVMLRVRIGDAGYVDAAGSSVPETLYVGRGKAVVLHEDRAVRATWSKRTLAAPLTLRAGGERLRVPAGRTWIELVPVEGGTVRIGG